MTPPPPSLLVYETLKKKKIRMILAKKGAYKKSVQKILKQHILNPTYSLTITNPASAMVSKHNSYKSFENVV